MNNTCSEVALTFIYKKMFSDDSVGFKGGVNDLQIELQPVLDFIPGNNVKVESLQNPTEFQQKLQDLHIDKFYLTRIGKTGESGHFSVLYYDKDIPAWMYKSGSEINIQLTDNDNIISETFDKHFHYVSSGYSLFIQEINIQRLFALMNYIAIFRKLGNENIHQAFENFELKLQENDQVFLNILDNQFWQYRPTSLSVKDPCIIRKEVYYFLMLKKDKPGFLDLYLPLVDGDQQLTIQFLLGEALNQIRDGILSTTFITELVEKCNDYSVFQEILDGMQEFISKSDWLNVKKIFEYRKLSDSNDLQLNDLLKFCQHNNDKALTYFYSLEQAHELFASDSDPAKFISAILETKKKYKYSWDTIEQSLMIILDHILQTRDMNKIQSSILVLKGHQDKFQTKVYCEGDYKNTTIEELFKKYGFENMLSENSAHIQPQQTGDNFQENSIPALSTAKWSFACVLKLIANFFIGIANIVIGVLSFGYLSSKTFDYYELQTLQKP